MSWMLWKPCMSHFTLHKPLISIYLELFQESAELLPWMWTQLCFFLVVPTILLAGERCCEGKVLLKNTTQDVWWKQGWCSGKSARLPPMWPGFDLWTRRHKWVEFVGSLLCFECFFFQVLWFSPLPKNQHLISFDFIVVHLSPQWETKSNSSVCAQLVNLRLK